MSLEKALADHTAAILELVSALNNNTETAIGVHNLRTTGLAEKAPAEKAEDTEAETPAEDTEAKKKAAAEKKAKAAADKKAKAAAAKKAKEEAEAAEPEEEEEEAEAEAEAAEAPSMDDVKAAALRCRDADKAAFAAVKKALNIATIKDLPEENRAMFIRQCDAAVEAADEEV